MRTQQESRVARATPMRRWLAGLGALAAALAAAPAADADSWRHRHDGQHKNHHKEFKHHHRGHHGGFVVRPAWPSHAWPHFHAPPRYVVHHRHRPWYPAYGAPIDCRFWQGPIWNGRYYEHGYGTICLMPDGIWRLMD